MGRVAVNCVNGRGGQIRTADLLVPNQAPCLWATPRIPQVLVGEPDGRKGWGKGRRAGGVVDGVVSPERVELSSLAPEASTLSVELRGHAARAIFHSIPRRRPFNKMPGGEISGENPEKSISPPALTLFHKGHHGFNRQLSRCNLPATRSKVVSYSPTRPGGRNPAFSERE